MSLAESIDVDAHKFLNKELEAELSSIQTTSEIYNEELDESQQLTKVRMDHVGPHITSSSIIEEEKIAFVSPSHQERLTDIPYDVLESRVRNGTLLSIAGLGIVLAAPAYAMTSGQSPSDLSNSVALGVTLTMNSGLLLGALGLSTRITNNAIKSAKEVMEREVQNTKELIQIIRETTNERIAAIDRRVDELTG